MDEKTLDAQQIAEEELEAIVGGTRTNARLEVRARVVDDSDEGNDGASPWIVMCPMCMHTLRYCTCARK